MLPCYVISLDTLYACSFANGTMTLHGFKFQSSRYDQRTHWSRPQMHVIIQCSADDHQMHTGQQHAAQPKMTMYAQSALSMTRFHPSGQNFLISTNICPTNAHWPRPQTHVLVTTQRFLPNSNSMQDSRSLTKYAQRALAMTRFHPSWHQVTDPHHPWLPDATCRRRRPTTKADQITPNLPAQSYAVSTHQLGIIFSCCCLHMPVIICWHHHFGYIFGRTLCNHHRIYPIYDFEVPRLTALRVMHYVCQFFPGIFFQILWMNYSKSLICFFLFVLDQFRSRINIKCLKAWQYHQRK